jgi:hypothetical protein
MVNVGTANNDDYSGYQFPANSPNAGLPVRLADSVKVQPLTYGKSDADWIKWVLTPLPVYNPQKAPSPAAANGPLFARSEGPIMDNALGVNFENNEAGTTKAAAPVTEAPTAETTATANTPQPANDTVIPGEWNYYGDMGLTMMNVNVVGITDPYNSIPASLKTQLQQGQLSFNNRPDSTGRSTGMLIDVNPEDPTNSQIFTDFLSMASGGQFLFSGKPTKGVTRWINFQRNNNLSGPNGAAATFQMSIPLAELQGQPILQGMPTTSPEGKPLIGITCRFTLYRPLQKINVFKYDQQQWIAEMLKLYSTQGLNPDYIELQATVGPWFQDEPASCPVGRMMIPTTNTIPVPAGNKSNGPAFSLAPAIAYVNWKQNVISIDCSATFPDAYQGQYDPMVMTDNPKWNFGQLHLGVIYQGQQQLFADINYAPTIPNDSLGWIFDIPFDPTIPGLKDRLATGDFVFYNKQYGALLSETLYMAISEQSCIYAEQDPKGGSVNQFRNDGPGTVPASFIIYKKGVQLTAADPDTFALWYYDTTPNQAPGNRTPLVNGYKSGDPISFPVGSPGNRLITAVQSTYSPPPVEYGKFNPLVMPIINLRILPWEDFSQYYQDPTAAQPVGNSKLTFEVIYDTVFRNYYLLYPAMSQRIPLNNPQYWDDAEMAGRLMQRVSLDFWGTAEAMPRTRDLSESRRTLITAWCLTFFPSNTQ